MSSASSKNRRSEDGQKVKRNPRHEINLLDIKNTSFGAELTKSPSGIKSVAMNQLRAIEDNCISANSHRSKKNIEESKISFE